MSRALPEHANLEHLRKQARELLQAARRGEATALARFRAEAARAAPRPVKLSDAQHVVAREYGFASWPALRAHLASRQPPADPLAALAAAVMANDTDRVAAVLRRHPALKVRLDEPLPGLAFGGTALLHAVHARNLALIDLLLASGADINGRSHWWAGGFGVLDQDDHRLASWLIERGALVDGHAAARLGLLENLEDLIRNDPAVVHARGGDGQTPLHVAATVEVARCLLDHGADIDATDVDHESTPAQYLIRDRTEVARFLVDRGATTDILLAAALGDAARVRRHLGSDPASIRLTVSPEWFPMRNPRAGGTIYIWTLGAYKGPHQVARDFGHPEVEQLLMDRSPDDLRLALACEAGNEDLVGSLLGEAPGLATKIPVSDLGRLAAAAERDDTLAVRLMLRAGWPVNARGHQGATALHWAAWHGNVAAVLELLRHRADPGAVDGAQAQSPLGWALHGSLHSWHRERGDHVAVVRALMEAGAPPPAPPAGAGMSEAVGAELERWDRGRAMGRA